MELRHLRYFIMLAEELHFGKASKRLFISQPPLSRQIKELETELGASLFMRNNKRVELTEAGVYFLEKSKDILDGLESAKQQVKQISNSLAGELKIGYISSVDKNKLGHLIQNLQVTHPYLQTKMHELRTSKQISALEHGKLDIGIIRAPNHSPQLITDHLYEDRFCIAVPKGFAVPSDLTELATYPFISYHANYAPVYHNLMMAFCAKLGFTPRLRHECNNISSILELVHLKAGISIVPLSVEQQYKHLDIQFLSIDANDIKTEILLAYSKETKHPAVQILREDILTLFSKPTC